jgi:C-terminal processing protease CtpA/Prc
MKRFLPLAIAALAALTTLAACTKHEEPTYTGFVSLDESEITVNNQRQPVELVITSNVEWTLTADVDWLVPTVTNGGPSDGETVTAIVRAYTDGDTERKGSLILTATDDLRAGLQKFTVYQTASNDPVLPETDISSKIPNQLNHDIYDLMRDMYYWNDAVKRLQNAPPKSNSNNPQEFLESLINSLVNAQDNTEEPPTIDGVWNSSGTAREAIYSNIQSLGYTRVAGFAPGFGFGFEPLDKNLNRITYGDDVRYLFVTWTQADSPAGDAGLVRGTLIDRYAAGANATPQTVSYDLYAQMYYQLQGSGPAEMKLVDANGNNYSLTRRTISNSPIIVSKTITSQRGTKVGYFVYNVFDQGEGKRNDTEMRQAFAGFKSEGIQHLVVDLRYNGGGHVVCSQLLATLAGNTNPSQVFAKLLRNEGAMDYFPKIGLPLESNPEVMKFLDEPAQNCLGLRRVYVLTTRATASAAEMFINSLRGVGVEVIVIGTQTNGKNVGMDVVQFTSGSMVYALAPITFKSVNAVGFCDYAGGFRPDYNIDELRALRAGKTTHELGNPQEELLQAALTHIDGGTPLTDPLTRAMSHYPVGLLGDPAANNAIMHQITLP